MIVKPGIPENLKWFAQARFGMMVHFGLYALHGRGEWVMYRENIRKEEYEKLAERFNPNLFNAEEWVELATRSGCRYITFTAKHHDGFCMYDSACTDYKITNTPFGRDLMRELIDACHRHGMRILIYYSQPDWHHINYVHHAGAFKDLTYTPTGQQPDWPKYKEYLFYQVEEICANYGQIDGIFFDGSHKTVEEWGGQELYALIKRYQPNAVVNDRARFGDFFTPEREAVENIDRELGYHFLLEICTSVTKKGWGYVTDVERTSVTYHLEQMVKAARIGCNYALNVGPAPNGTIPLYCREVFDIIGHWMNRHSEGYIGTEAVFPHLPEERYVMMKRDHYLYLFCLKWPDSEILQIPGIHNTCLSVRLLSTGEAIPFERRNGELTLLKLPLLPPDGLIQAFRLELDGEPEIDEVSPKIEIAKYTQLAEHTVLAPEKAFMEGYGVKGVKLKVIETETAEQTDGEAGKESALPLKQIGGWMTPEQKAIWYVDAERETDAVLTLIVWLDRDYENAQAEIFVNDTVIRRDVPPFSASKAVPISFGRVHLKSGKNRIVLHASRLLWGYKFPNVIEISLDRL
ncbi:MAG: alpha-L-fucosidase [Eubacteriales bacterium]